MNASAANHLGEIDITPITREIDLGWAIALCKKYRDELGAVHLGVLPALVASAAGRVRLGSSQGQLMGVIVTRKMLQADPRITPVVAAAVPTDLRRIHVGLALVADIEAEASRDGRTIIQAICRFDLPSNAFWAAAGFTPAFVRFTESARGKESIVWRKAIGATRPDLAERHAPTKPRAAGGRFAPTISPGNAVLFPGYQTAESVAVERYEHSTSIVAATLRRSPLSESQRIEALSRALKLHPLPQFG